MTIDFETAIFGSYPQNLIVLGSEVVQLILHERPCYNRYEQAEQQIQYSAVARRHTLLLLCHVDLLALLVAPVQAVNIAGYDREKKYHAAGCSLCSSCGIGVIGQADQPVKTIDPAGNDGQNDAYCDVSLLNHK